jgi:hypothetical protein
MNTSGKRAAIPGRRRCRKRRLNGVPPSRVPVQAL